MEHLDDGQLQVDGSLSIDEVNELIGDELPEGDWDTVGGFLYHLLGHVPEEGEAADFDGHRLVAQKVDGRRIARVLIGVSAPEGAANASYPPLTGRRRALTKPRTVGGPGPVSAPGSWPSRAGPTSASRRSST